MDTPNTPDTPFEVGKKYFIRTVTYHQVGLLAAIKGNFLVLENASYIADSGRFMQAIRKGELDEVEPVGVFFVNLNAIADAFPIEWELPTEQK